MKQVSIMWEDCFDGYEEDVFVYVDGKEVVLKKTFDSVLDRYTWVGNVGLERDQVYKLDCQEGFTGPDKISTANNIWRIYKDSTMANEDILVQRANNTDEEEFAKQMEEAQKINTGEIVIEQNIVPHEGNMINFALFGILFIVAIIGLLKLKSKWKLLVIIPFIASLVVLKPVFADLTRGIELKNFYNGKSRFTYWNISKKTLDDYDQAMKLVKDEQSQNEYDVSDIVSDYINKMTVYYNSRTPRIETLRTMEEDPNFTKSFLDENCAFLEDEFKNLDAGINSFELDLTTMLEKIFIHKSDSPAWDWYMTTEQLEKLGKKEGDVYRFDLPFGCQFEFVYPKATKNNIRVKSVDLSELDKDDPLSPVYLIDSEGNKAKINISFDIKKGLNKNTMTLDIRDGILFAERFPAHCAIIRKTY